MRKMSAVVGSLVFGAWRMLRFAADQEDGAKMAGKVLDPVVEAGRAMKASDIAQAGFWVTLGVCVVGFFFPKLPSRLVAGAGKLSYKRWRFQRGLRVLRDAGNALSIENNRLLSDIHKPREFPTGGTLEADLAETMKRAEEVLAEQDRLCAMPREYRVWNARLSAYLASALRAPAYARIPDVPAGPPDPNYVSAPKASQDVALAINARIRWIIEEGPRIGAADIRSTFRLEDEVDA